MLDGPAVRIMVLHMVIWGRESKLITMEAKGIPYAELNRKIRHQLTKGTESIRLKNVNGQRYIGDALRGKQKIIIEGTPGNDLAAYMDGLFI